jgi:hypothetical protein
LKIVRDERGNDKMKSINKRLVKIEKQNKPAALDGVVIVKNDIYKFLGKEYTEAEFAKLCNEKGVKNLVYIHNDI